MATGTKRTAELQIGVSTSGTDAVKTLRTEVANLAKEGGDAAPEFQRLGAELDRIAAQQNAIDTFATLKREVVDLGTGMVAAAADVDRLGAQLPEVTSNTRLFVQAQTEAKVALALQKDLLAGARAELTKLQADTIGAARSTDEYKVSVGELKATIAQLRTNVREANDEFRSTQAATKEAVTAEKTLTAEFNASLNTAKELSSELATRNGVLESSRAVLAANGVETTKLNEAQRGLKDTLGQITKEINEQTSATTTARASQQAFEAIANEVAQALQREQLAAEQATKSQLEQQASIAAIAKATADYLAEQQAVVTQTEAAAAAQREIATATQQAARQWQEEAEALVNAKLATEQQIKETNKLVAVQQELIAQRAFDQTAAQAKKLVEAGNYVRFWEEALKEADETQKRVAQSAKAAAAALDDAFAKTGVRSTQAIQTEIAQINDALIKLASNARVSGGDFDRAFATAQQRIEKLQTELKGVPGEVDKTSGAVGYLRQQFSQLAAIYGGIQLGQAFIDANVQIEMLRRTLAFVTGSTAEAAKQIQLLRDVADRTGVSVGSIADAFVRFNASARQAGISGKVVEELFIGITTAGGKMGLSSDRVALSLEAVSQIAGKGVVSMEELRGQLGDSLPGAMTIAARSVGLTVSEFTKLVESGKVLSEEFLPAFAAEFTKTFGDGTAKVEGFIQGWSRLKNAITAVAQQASDSTAFKALGGTMDFLAKNMQTVVDGSYAIGKAFIALKAVQLIGEFTGITAALQANAIAQERNALAVAERAAAQRTAIVTQEIATTATAADTVATNANTVAKKANALAWGTLEGNLSRGAAASAAAATSTGVLATAATLGGNALRGLSAIVGGLPGLFLATVVSGKEVGTWIGESIAKWRGYGKVLEENEAKSKAFEEASKKSAQAAAQLPASWLQVASAYEKSTAAAAKNVTVQEKLADAAAKSAETSTKVAQLSGNEAEARTVAATAALNLVAAYENVEAAQRTQLDLLTEERQKLIDSAGGEENLTQAKRDSIKALDEKIAKSKAETEQSIAATQAAKEEAAARTTAVQVNLDNSQSLDVLKQAYLDAVESAKALAAAQKEGFATQTRVDDANLRAAAAQRVYIDALNDTVRAIERKALQGQVLAIQGKSSADLNLQQAITEEKLAASIGNTFGVVQAQIKQKEAQIKVTEANISAITNEAQNTIAAANARREELAATGELNADRQQEIDYTIAAAKAKLTEADAIKEKVKQLQIEIDTQLRQRAAVSLSGSDDDRNKRVTAESAAADKKRTADSAALSELATSYVNSPAYQLLQKQKNGTLTKDDVPLAQTNFDAAKANLTNAQSSATQYSSEGFQAVLREFNEARAILDAANSQRISGAPSSEEPTATSKAPTSTTHVVQIDLGGRKTSINVASAADANSLTNMLRELEDASRRAAG